MDDALQHLSELTEPAAHTTLVAAVVACLAEGEIAKAKSIAATADTPSEVIRDAVFSGAVREDVRKAVVNLTKSLDNELTDTNLLQAALIAARWSPEGPSWALDRAVYSARQGVPGCCDLLSDFCAVAPSERWRDAMSLLALRHLSGYIDSKHFGPLLMFLHQAQQHRQVLQLWKWMKHSRACLDRMARSAVICAHASAGNSTELLDHLEALTNDQLQLDPAVRIVVLEHLLCASPPQWGYITQLLDYWDVKEPSELAPLIKLLSSALADDPRAPIPSMLTKALHNPSFVSLLDEEFLAIILPCVQRSTNAYSAIPQIASHALALPGLSTEVLGFLVACAAVAKQREVVLSIGKSLLEGSVSAEELSALLQSLISVLSSQDWAAGRAALLELASVLGPQAAQELQLWESMLPKSPSEQEGDWWNVPPTN